MAELSHSLRVTDVKRDAASVTQESRTAIAALVYDASNDFYDCFGLPRTTLLDVIADQVFRSGTELSNIRVLWLADQVGGILTWVPADELNSARAASAALLLRRLTPAERRDAAARLADYSATVEPFEPEGIYFSRQASRPEYRGRGLGRRLLRAVIDEIGHQTLNMHTRGDNDAVLRIYGPEGFERVSDRDFAWSAWIRHPQPRGRG